MSCEAWVGFIGVVVGAFIQIAGNLLKDFYDTRKANRIEKARKAILVKYLRGAKGDGWVSIETLAGLVGAPIEVTCGLLIESDARGSAKPEKRMWSLIERNPLWGKGE